MKRITKRIIAVLLATMMVFTLFACGKDSEATDDGSGDVLKGTWTRHDDFYGDIVLKVDGKGGCTFKYSAEGMSDDIGSYKIDSDTELSVKLDSWEDYQTCTYKIEGNKLIISDNYSIFEGEYTKK